MKVKNLNWHCGECCLIDYCDEPYSEICICTDCRFKDRELSEVEPIFIMQGDKYTGEVLLDKVYEVLEEE